MFEHIHNEKLREEPSPYKRIQPVSPMRCEDLLHAVNSTKAFPELWMNQRESADETLMWACSHLLVWIHKVPHDNRYQVLRDYHRKTQPAFL